MNLRLPSVRQIACLYNFYCLDPEGGDSLFFQALAILPTAQGANTDRHETLKSVKAIPLQAWTGLECSKTIGT
jgi:hypothetical protein